MQETECRVIDREHALLLLLQLFEQLVERLQVLADLKICFVDYDNRRNRQAHICLSQGQSERSRLGHNEVRFRGERWLLQERKLRLGDAEVSV